MKKKIKRWLRLERWECNRLLDEWGVNKAPEMELQVIQGRLDLAVEIMTKIEMLEEANEWNGNEWKSKERT
jgi:hypothetical protein